MSVYNCVYILAGPSTMPTEGIIGAAVGGLVLMVVVVILAVFIMRLASLIGHFSYLIY